MYYTVKNKIDSLPKPKDNKKDKKKKPDKNKKKEKVEVIKKLFFDNNKKTKKNIFFAKRMTKLKISYHLYDHVEIHIQERRRY